MHPCRSSCRWSHCDRASSSLPVCTTRDNAASVRRTAAQPVDDQGPVPSISITDPSCVTMVSLPICARILSTELPAPVSAARLHSSRLSVAPAGSHSSMPLLWNTECAQPIHATMRTPHPRFIDGGSSALPQDSSALGGCRTGERDEREERTAENAANLT